MKCTSFVTIFAIFNILCFNNCSDPVSNTDNNYLTPDANGNLHIYVNPLGNNKNLGVSPSKPLKNIYKAIEITISHKRSRFFIHLSEGIYSTEKNGEKFPLAPKASTKIIGAGEGKTVIKGQKTGDHRESIIFLIYTENVLISKMTLLDAGYGVLLDYPAVSDTLSYLELNNNTNGILHGEGCSVAHHVTVRNSDLALSVTNVQNCLLESNKIALTTSSSGEDSYRNLIIFKNDIGIHVSLGLFGSANKINAENIVIANNNIGLKCDGVMNNVKISEIKNSIIWKNEQPVITVCTDSTNYIYKCGFQFAYCDIRGIDQLETCEDQTIFNLVGNFHADPLFIDPENGDFRLQSNSPCIDAGDPATEFLDPDGSRNDLGAFGGSFGTW